MSKKQLSDQEVLSSIREGKAEEQALEYLYSTLLPKVKMICKKYKVADVDAYDVFQESIIKLYDYVKRDKFSESYAIEAFLLTIAKNRVLDSLRKKNRRTEIEIGDFNIPEGLQINTDVLVSADKKDALDKLFALVGERCSELLLLRKYDKRSMTEIKEIMSFSSENSAKTQVYKCKQKLLKAVEDNPMITQEVLTNE